MSGDVFGNGMLLSEHIRLVAAFDHRHIFVDPTPTPPTSYRRAASGCSTCRGRAGRTTTATLISAGGGVFPRSAKSIPITPRGAQALGIDGRRPTMTPAELIRAILLAPVDLLWNGGIGTYVKASTRVQRRGRRQGQRRDPGQRRASCAARSSARAATSASPSSAGSSTPLPAAGSTPTSSTTPPASTPPTTRSTSRSCSTGVVRRGELTDEAAQRAAGRR